MCAPSHDCKVCEIRESCLGETEPELPNAVQFVSDSADCPECGEELNHGHQKACSGCGIPLVWSCCA